MTRPLPRDPVLREAIAVARSRERERRAMLSRRAVLGGLGLGVGALALAGCAPVSRAAPTAAVDESASDPRLVWDNWPAYLDEDDDGGYPTLTAFEEQSGISVTYNVAVDDNNSYYGKVKDQLALGQYIGADTVCLTEWMVSRLARRGYIQELDHANIPNIANLTPSLANPDFDPGRHRSLPFQAGFAGICWNKEKLPNGLASVEDLWDPALRGRVGVLSEMRDTIGLIMLAQGTDIAGSWGDDEFMNAIDVFRKQVDEGQIRNIKGNAYLNDLQNEDTLAAICWSGDITLINTEAGDKWEFALPDSGGTLWNDTFVVPMGSQRKANAEALMNYYYEPEVAAEVAAWVNYITPVDGAKDAMESIDPELAENQLIFPDEDTLAQSHIFRTLTADEEKDYQAEFQKVLLGI
ncbi:MULTISPECIES: ABC transporter substrate-binding protein [Rathayibacter]|uniref:Polyamine ABC transporter substrate-binding protein n=2 Tax=Rathayibacter festucae TaxID=110937 RepID=A0A3Q9UUS5_9MICO|nr:MULTISPECIES: spermidine/putrescine ABC transporter substrate-binding protein [Rathayibacter]AZZ51187.1 polyamine ABC transporter substrate-binding protein [Rathayibacter festucae DSM 15932]MCJ1672952.1 spermidine/putrescine ABC transporter substrate-binding protein [Rathayibacter sp. VKM Ac-2929]MCJ1685631.1 spermidine/putrescine ABC transporter substrate-binding protein [Rathayibacter sp. VKM Ac-2927]MCJ1699690.1 spermidine/putrescine ABC transporter substrate-binding protein [Rathayibacte